TNFPSRGAKSRSRYLTNANPTPARRKYAMSDEKETGAIPRRRLGRADVMISALGIGGHHLGDFQTVEDGIRFVHEAVDAGVTFCDNCWEYWNGRAEDWMGRALVGRRDKV